MSYASTKAPLSSATRTTCTLAALVGLYKRLQAKTGPTLTDRRRCMGQTVSFQADEGRAVSQNVADCPNPEHGPSGEVRIDCKVVARGVWDINASRLASSYQPDRHHAARQAAGRQVGVDEEHPDDSRGNRPGGGRDAGVGRSARACHRCNRGAALLLRRHAGKILEQGNRRSGGHWRLGNVDPLKATFQPRRRPSWQAPGLCVSRLPWK